MLLSFRPRTMPASFRHPLDPAPRTAILVPGFQSSRSIRVFPEGWNTATAKFVPAAVAGTFDQLLEVAERGVQLSHCVICLCWNADDLLSSSERETLWQSFGVPIFEQVLDDNNELIAYECEGHGSLHVTDRYAVAAGAAIDCACGSNVQRLGRRSAGFVTSSQSQEMPLTG